MEVVFEEYYLYNVKRFTQITHALEFNSLPCKITCILNWITHVTIKLGNAK